MKIQWHNEKRTITELNPAKYNPRRLTDKSKSWWRAKNLGKWTNPKNIAERNKQPDIRAKVSVGLKAYFKIHPRNQEKWYIERYGVGYVPKKHKHSNIWRSLSKKLRLKYSCHKCHSTEYLDVHHIIPFAISKDHSIKNMVVLCRKCHKSTEDNNLKILNIVGDWDIVRILYKHRFNDVGKPITYET